MKSLVLLLFTSWAFARPSDAFMQDSKIVGGHYVKTEDVPFIVSIQHNGQHICGGTLLTLSSVLTACHCIGYVVLGTTAENIKLRRADLLNVVAGEEDLTQWKGPMRFVSKVLVHPQCSYKAILSFDFGMAFLTKPFDATSNIKPLKVTATDGSAYNKIVSKIVNKNLKCLVTGWGSDKKGSTRAHNKLKAAEIRLIPDSECSYLLTKLNTKYSQYNFKGNAQICSLPYTPEKNDSDCYGDSGGPVYCDTYLVGVVSYGFDCGLSDTPNVYARFANFLAWYPQVKKYDEASDGVKNRAKPNILLWFCLLSAFKRSHIAGRLF